MTNMLAGSWSACVILTALTANSYKLHFLLWGTADVEKQEGKWHRNTTWFSKTTASLCFCKLLRHHETNSPFCSFSSSPFPSISWGSFTPLSLRPTVDGPESNCHCLWYLCDTTPFVSRWCQWCDVIGWTDVRVSLQTDRSEVPRRCWEGCWPHRAWNRRRHSSAAGGKDSAVCLGLPQTTCQAHFNLTNCVWLVRGNQSTRRKPEQALGEHTSI